MIRLTLASGNALFARAEWITSIFRSSSLTDSFTYVMVDGRQFYVTETPEEIVKLLEEPK